MNIRQGIERDVGAEDLKDYPLRLEGVQGSPRPRRLGEKNRVGSQIGPDFKDRRSGLDELAEDINLALGKLPVTIQRLADELVGHQIEHRPMTALLESNRAVIQ
jgi:hypothetical protein